MTQNARILSWLEQHDEGVTQLEAFNTLGCCRLSERVRELSNAPYHCHIEHRPARTHNGAHVIRYVLIEGPHELEPVPFAGWI